MTESNIARVDALLGSIRLSNLATYGRTRDKLGQRYTSEAVECQAHTPITKWKFHMLKYHISKQEFLDRGIF